MSSLMSFFEKLQFSFGSFCTNKSDLQTFLKANVLTCHGMKKARKSRRFISYNNASNYYMQLVIN